jgi:hypothetical protein
MPIIRLFNGLTDNEETKIVDNKTCIFFLNILAGCVIIFVAYKILFIGFEA